MDETLLEKTKDELCEECLADDENFCEYCPYKEQNEEYR